MSSQTLIIQLSASGGADCEQTSRPQVVVEMLTGDATGVKAAIPMLPILMDHCKGMLTRIGITFELSPIGPMGFRVIYFRPSPQFTQLYRITPTYQPKYR